MSSLKPLADFFQAIAHDPRISITHIGIYAALLQYWQKHNFENSFYYYNTHLSSIHIKQNSYQNGKNCSNGKKTKKHNESQLLHIYNFIISMPIFNII